MPNPENLKKWKSGESGNPKGMKPGTKSKKTQLKKLLKHLSQITDKLTGREKLLAYQLYEIAETDIYANSISSSVNHLYFIESEFGIKIGISKEVNKRLKQILNYAPSSKILKVINYAGKFESDLHRKFEHLNIKNNQTIGIEWFSKGNDLIEFIDEIETIEDLHKYFNPKGTGQMILF